MPDETVPVYECTVALLFRKVHKALYYSSFSTRFLYDNKKVPILLKKINIKKYAGIRSVSHTVV